METKFMRNRRLSRLQQLLGIAANHCIGSESTDWKRSCAYGMYWSYGKKTAVQINQHELPDDWIQTPRITAELVENRRARSPEQGRSSTCGSSNFWCMGSWRGCRMMAVHSCSHFRDFRHRLQGQTRGENVAKVFEPRQSISPQFSTKDV
jgi:hypothetical protein